MSCKITKNSLTASIKDQIINNATSYNEGLDWVFIPIGKNITNLIATQKVAEKTAAKINARYDSASFGKPVSIQYSTEGTMLRIHPTDLLVDSLNLSLEFEEDFALKEQEDREEKIEQAIKDKLENDIKNGANKVRQIEALVFLRPSALKNYLKESTNPMLYKIIKTQDGWQAKLRPEFSDLIPVINKIENCR